MCIRDSCNSKLNNGGKLFILTLEISRNEIPTFSLMKKKLRESIKRDKKIIRFICQQYPQIKKRGFSFRVKILKNKYKEMIKNRYISTLLNFSDKEILNGIDEIHSNFKKMISFNDKLICLILEK